MTTSLDFVVPVLNEEQALTGSIDEVQGDIFDLIVANLESHLVRPLLPGIVAGLAAGGTALFSGLLETERARFLDWLWEEGLTVDGTWSKSDWFSCRSRA